MRKQLGNTGVLRDWQPDDRAIAAQLVQSVLQEFGLPWEPEATDRDVIEVEQFYLQRGGVFWVIEKSQTIMGTAAYYPINRGQNAVEIRKMYLHSNLRGQGMGSRLLQELEGAIEQAGFTEIWLETSTRLPLAIKLYERAGYVQAAGVETPRCDRVYHKVLASGAVS